MVEAPPRHLVLRPGVHVHGRLREHDHLSRRRRGHPALPGLSRSSSWPSTRPTWRWPTCSSTASCPTPTQFDAWTNEITIHTFIHENVRKRFLDGFHYDAHPMGMLVSAVAALSTFYPEAKEIFDRESPAQADHPADRQDADPGGRRPPVQRGDALRLPGQLPRLLRELPVHDVEGGRAPLRGRSHADPGPRRAVHPPRRPRAELLDHGDAGGGFVPRRSLLGLRRRLRRPVRATSRRSQRGGHPDADRDRLHRERARLRRVGQGR